MRRYVTEFLGTFGFMFIIGAVLLNRSHFAPVAVGAAFAAFVYAGAHISGGHYNPAVSLGFFLRGRLAVSDLLPYWAAQLAGAALAAATVNFLYNPRAVRALEFSTGRRITVALVAEFILTFLLVYVFLSVAASSKQRDNSFYGLAVGLTVFVGAAGVGILTGAAFNPAVALGSAILGLFAWSTLWVYPVATLAAGAAAAFVFRYLNPEDCEPLQRGTVVRGSHASTLAGSPETEPVYAAASTDTGDETSTYDETGEFDDGTAAR